MGHRGTDTLIAPQCLLSVALFYVYCPTHVEQNTAIFEHSTGGGSPSY
jgi:hypothetical protein